MSIFPFIDSVTDARMAPASWPVPREYAWDFERGEFVRENGKMVVVEGREAIKIWIYKALLTARYQWPIYSWNYGSELETLIGSSYSPAATQSEAQRFIKECLLINPYIKSVHNLQTRFREDRLAIAFTAVTDYGEVSVDV